MAGSRPKVILSAAMTVDGRIASRSGDSSLSSPVDRRRLHRLRAKADAIAVGRRTIDIDDPLLTVRLARGKNPTRIIFDSRGTIPSRSKIMMTCDKIPTVIAVSKKITKRNLRRLEKFPVRIIMAGGDRVAPRKILEILYRDGLRTVLLEGGSELNWEFVRLGLVDEAIITISPRIVGGTGAVPLVGGRGFESMTKAARLRLAGVSRLKNELVIRYCKL